VAGASKSDIDVNARQVLAALPHLKVDPGIGPLLQVRLLKLADQEHWLVLTLHRLIGDCFSADQVFRELWSVYRELVAGRTPALAVDPPQYADYALWQRSTQS